MSCHTKSISRLPITLVICLAAITFVELGLAVPVPIESNGRALRSVSLGQNSWNENNPVVANLLLSQKQQNQHQQNATGDPVLAQRENQTGDGTFAEDSGDGSNEVEIDDGDGTFSNDTRAGSRLKNETCSLEPASLCSSVDPTHSNRDKQRRIAHIVNFLWTNVFGNRTRPVNKEAMRDRLNPVNPSSSSFSGGLESIPASCDLPPEVESEAWSSERYYSLYFNLSSKYPDILGSLEMPTENSSTKSQQQAKEGESHESGHSQEYLPIIGPRPFFTTLTVTPTKSVNIISAKLRLYKIGTSEYASTVPSLADLERTSEPCNDTDVDSSGSEEELVPSVLPSTRMAIPEFTPSVDEKIRVSIFWYTQPATKNHYKKKLVDAKMFSLRESSWVEFDIKNAVTAWLNERKPNYGLVIEVENENQDALDPRAFFRSDPCFKSSTLSEGASQQDNTRGDGTSDRDVNSAMAPVIEICTLNLPETTANYEHTKFFPYSMNINSINHLQRVAETHAKSGNASTRPSIPQNINLRVLSPEDFGIPNPNSNRNRNSDNSDVLRQTIIVPSHKHRHNHQIQHGNGNHNGNTNKETPVDNRQHQRTKSKPHHNVQEYLSPDHPLKHILATINGNSKESSRRTSGTQQYSDSGTGFPSNLVSEMPADEGRAESDYLDSTEHDRDVFITKIIISPAQLRQTALNGLSNKKQLVPVTTSMAPSASLDPVNSQTLTTSGDSSER